MDNKNTALLVMDVQKDTVKVLKESDALLSAIRRATNFAHKHEIPVIYVVVGFRNGYPEISPRNARFSAIKDNQDFLLNKEVKLHVHPAIATEPKDIFIVKKRVSAFTGSDLEVVLRSLGIWHMVLSGISTSGVVLSTLREAADKDFELTVLSDCCADRDDEVHHVLLEKVFPKQANVLTSTAWTEA